jgi:hypothetical protein
MIETFLCLVAIALGGGGVMCSIAAVTDEEPGISVIGAMLFVGGFVYWGYLVTTINIYPWFGLLVSIGIAICCVIGLLTSIGAHVFGIPGMIVYGIIGYSMFSTLTSAVEAPPLNENVTQSPIIEIGQPAPDEFANEQLSSLKEALANTNQLLSERFPETLTLAKDLALKTKKLLADEKEEAYKISLEEKLREYAIKIILINDMIRISGRKKIEFERLIDELELDKKMSSLNVSQDPALQEKVGQYLKESTVSIEEKVSHLRASKIFTDAEIAKTIEDL